MKTDQNKSKIKMGVVIREEELVLNYLRFKVQNYICFSININKGVLGKFIQSFAFTIYIVKVFKLELKIVGYELMNWFYNNNH